MFPMEWLAQPVFRGLTLTLLHFVWQGLVIAAALVVVTQLGNVRRATIRYACSLVALGAVAFCPPMTLVWLSLQQAGHAAGADVIDRLPAAMVLGAGSPAHWLDRAQPYAIGVWLAGVIVFGSRLLCGAIGVLRLRRGRLPLPAKLRAIAERIGRDLKIEAASLTFLSQQVSEAMAVGIVRPLVLIPASWATEIPLEMLEAVIAHELAHLARRDLLVNLLQRIIETLLFYHPAVWWLSRRLRIERELCCDELAVRVTGQRLSYVEALENVARRRAAGVQPALATGIRGEKNMQLLERVRNVLGPIKGEQPRLWPAGLIALVLPLAVWGTSLVLVGPAATVAQADDERLERRKANAERGRQEEEEDADDDRPRKRTRRDADDDEDEKTTRSKRDDDGDEKKTATKRPALELTKEALAREYLAKQALQTAERGLDQARALADKGIITKQQVEAAELALEKANRQLEVAQKRRTAERDGDENERKQRIGDKELNKKEPEFRERKVILKDGERVAENNDRQPGKETRQIAELAEMVKRLSGQVERLQGEVAQLRGEKTRDKQSIERRTEQNRLRPEAEKRSELDARKRELEGTAEKIEIARRNLAQQAKALAERAASLQGARLDERELKELAEKKRAIEEKIRSASEKDEAERKVKEKNEASERIRLRERDAGAIEAQKRKAEEQAREAREKAEAVREKVEAAREKAEAVRDKVKKELQQKLERLKEGKETLEDIDADTDLGVTIKKLLRGEQALLLGPTKPAPAPTPQPKR